MMPSIHTPQRLPDEPFYKYQDRRKESQRAVKRILRGTPNYEFTIYGFLTPKLKNTKHTRKANE